MINELIIVLTDPQQAELIKRAKAAGYDDDLEYLQLHLNSWLSSSKLDRSVLREQIDKVNNE